MSTATMPRPTLVAPRVSRDATPQQIIEAARTAPATALAAFLVAGVGSLLAWASFTPLEWAPLGWIALVPLTLLIRIERPTRAMYRALYLTGLVFWIPTLQWMRLGDTTMYGAWLLASAILALYHPLFVWLGRVALHRLRVPLIAAVPVVWTGLELLRAHLPVSFSWYYLGHSQYRWLELIQIADITGVYGISFILALAAGCLGVTLPDSWLFRIGLTPGISSQVAPKPPKVLVPALACMATVTAVLGYGYWRRSQADFQPGPRMALIQGNFTASVRTDRRDIPLMFRRHERLTAVAMQKSPDVVVWPEGMFPYPSLHTTGATDEELDKKYPFLGVIPLRKLEVPKALRDLSQKSAAALIVGMSAVEVDPEQYRFYNTAQFVTTEGVAGRYDKIHRVIFGEYVPFVDLFPFLRNFTPYRGPFGIEAGKAGVIFEHKGIRYAPIICYEDTVAHLVRSIAAGSRDHSGQRQRVDVLVNISNDGWFHGSSEHDQHLITAAFRSVETRTPMVRAVNTGVSAVIDGDGMIRARAKDPRTGQSKQVEAVVVEDVPLDRRSSLYVATGDWFGGACLTGCLFIGVFGVAGSWFPKRRHTA